MAWRWLPWLLGACTGLALLLLQSAMQSGKVPRNVQPEVRFQAMPTFVLKHNSKAGGTFSRTLLKAVFKFNPSKKALWKIIDDDNALFPNDKKKNFVAVLMRNPCAWNVAWANECPTKAWDFGRPTFAANPLGPMGYLERHTTDTELRNWMLNARSPEGLGVISFYLWQSMVCPKCWGWHRKVKEGLNPKEGEHCNSSHRAQQDMAVMNPQSLAHCWIFQETLMEDMRVCLTAFEASHPAAADSVRWDLFEKAAANQSGEALFFERDWSVARWAAPSLQYRRHKPCE
ncbi:unnamed protein product, partial [Effrenium voratum]